MRRFNRKLDRIKERGINCFVVSESPQFRLFLSRCAPGYSTALYLRRFGLPEIQRLPRKILDFLIRTGLIEYANPYYKMGPQRTLPYFTSPEKYSIKFKDDYFLNN
jgi:hypothetical protein